eukprot:3929-Heterococcus_DN1.PRE.1
MRCKPVTLLLNEHQSTRVLAAESKASASARNSDCVITMLIELYVISHSQYQQMVTTLHARAEQNATVQLFNRQTTTASTLFKYTTAATAAAAAAAAAIVHNRSTAEQRTYLSLRTEELQK